MYPPAKFDLQPALLLRNLNESTFSLCDGEGGIQVLHYNKAPSVFLFYAIVGWFASFGLVVCGER